MGRLFVKKKKEVKHIEQSTMKNNIGPSTLATQDFLDANWFI